jgi:hypothetical protein
MLDGGRLRGGRRSSPGGRRGGLWGVDGVVHGVRVDGRRRKPHNVPHAREH